MIVPMTNDGITTSPIIQGAISSINKKDGGELFKYQRGMPTIYGTIMNAHQNPRSCIDAENT